MDNPAPVQMMMSKTDVTFGSMGAWLRQMKWQGKGGLQVAGRGGNQAGKQTHLNVRIPNI